MAMEARKAPESEIEKRTFDVMVETRADEKKVIRGYAAVFNQFTKIGKYFEERVLPGAFTETLQKDDQPAFIQPLHDDPTRQRQEQGWQGG